MYPQFPLSYHVSPTFSPCVSGGFYFTTMISMSLPIPPHFLQRWACGSSLANQTLISFETLGIVTWPKRSQWGHCDPVKGTFWLVQSEKRHAFSLCWNWSSENVSLVFLEATLLLESYLSVNGISTRGCRHERWRDTRVQWHCLSSGSSHTWSHITCDLHFHELIFSLWWYFWVGIFFTNSQNSSLRNGLWRTQLLLGAWKDRTKTWRPFWWEGNRCSVDKGEM